MKPSSVIDFFGPASISRNEYAARLSFMLGPPERLIGSMADSGAAASTGAARTLERNSRRCMARAYSTPPGGGAPGTVAGALRLCYNAHPMRTHVTRLLT